MRSEIFFHVGIERTGSTYLQDIVFPQFRNIGFIHKKDYSKAKEIIEENKHQKYLVSFELDLNESFEKEVIHFSSHFPDTTVIIVLRQHHEWIASKYKRHLKWGNNIPFEKFIDIKDDEGLYKKTDLLFANRIELLEKHFNKKPIVLFYDDFCNQPQHFIERISGILNVSIDKTIIRKRKKNSSFSEKQMVGLLLVMKYFNLKRKRIFRNGLVHFFYRAPKETIRYGTFYGMLLVPNLLIKKSIFPDHSLEKIKEYYKDDWEKCICYEKHTTEKFSTSFVKE